MRVNPGSPVEETWFVGRDATKVVAMWCDAIELEEALARDPHPDPEALMRQVRAYKLFLVPTRKADGSVYILADDRGAGVIHIFTALDNLNTFLGHFSPAVQDQLRPITIAGGAFFDLLAGRDDIAVVGVTSRNGL